MTTVATTTKEEPKYRSIIIDTLNQLMNDHHTKLMKDKERGATYDEWRDFGVELLDMYDWIKSLPNVIPIQVLGYEATGKTVGGSYLNPDETVWLNVDKKPLTFANARKMYPVDNSRKNYALVTGYDDIKNRIKQIGTKSKDPLIVFMLGHIEDYKAKDNKTRQRLKVLGKMATKYNIEGALSHTYYTDVDETKKWNDPSRYRLRTVSQNDTARSPMGMWDSEFIPNNYQLIVNKILADY